MESGRQGNDSCYFKNHLLMFDLPVDVHHASHVCIVFGLAFDCAGLGWRRLDFKGGCCDGGFGGFVFPASSRFRGTFGNLVCFCRGCGTRAAAVGSRIKPPLFRGCQQLAPSISVKDGSATSIFEAGLHSKLLIVDL